MGFSEILHPIRTTGVGSRAVAGGVRRGDDAAQVIGVEPALVAGVRVFVLRQRLIHAGTMHIAAQQGATAVVLGHQIDTVVKDSGNRDSGFD